MPDRVIIADTSCFIVLEKIGELDLLRQVYGQVVTTVDIAKEYGNMLPDWVVLMAVQDVARQQLIEIQLDKGESSAIAIALEISGSLIILDDAKARRFAERLGLAITGTLGVVVRAKLNGIIQSVKPILEKIKRTDFRISEDFEISVLRAADELRDS